MICGIIAEYDPFHNGHAWQLREARRLTQADHMICVISGSFTQRGMPALLAPHQRAQMALDAGADLVLQMPYSFSVCNAERFALGGVYILKQLGVEALCFGVEQDSIPIIENAAALLESPSDIFKKQLRQALDAGDSFPKAQGQALSQSLTFVGCALCVTAALLLALSFLRPGTKKICVSIGVIVGVAQGLAVFPGISRSGLTLLAGILCGLSAVEAFRFSFLLSLPAVCGAALLELRHFDGVLPAGCAAAMAVAFVFGVISLCLVHRVVVSGRWRFFAAYCAVVGLSVIFCL